MSALNEIEARLAAATPGPWGWRNTTEPYLQGARTRIVMAFRRMGTHAAQPQFRDSDGMLVDGGKANLNAFPDADLIARAPADLAALVQFAREVEAVLAEKYPADGEHSDEAFLEFEQARLDRLDAALQRIGGDSA